MAITTYAPNKADATYNLFTGVSFDDPKVYIVAGNKRIDAKYFLKPIQDEVLNLIDRNYHGYFSNEFAWRGVISPTSFGVDQNDYNPTSLSTATVLRLTPTANCNLTGISGGATGRILVIHNIGSFTLTLKNNNVGSSAANRFQLNADDPILTNQSRIIQYDATTAMWRVIGSGSSTGEANTGNNAGSAGVGPYDSKSGVALQFRNIVAGSTNLTVALDAPNKNIVIDLAVPIVRASLPTLAAYLDTNQTWTGSQTFNGFEAWGSVTPAQITADQNNYSPGAGSYVRLSSDATRTLTGMVAQNAGTLLIITNVGTSPIILAHQNASSTAANRFISPSSSDVTLSANFGAHLIYDGTQSRWQIINFYKNAGSGSGTVTNVSGTGNIAVATGTTTPVVSITSGAADSASALFSDGAGGSTFRHLSATDIQAGIIDLTTKVTNVLPVANGGSGSSTEYQTKSAPYTVVLTDNFNTLDVDSGTAAALNLQTLPAVGAGNKGMRVRIKKCNSDANVVPIVTNSTADGIDGQLTYLDGTTTAPALSVGTAVNRTGAVVTLLMTADPRLKLVVGGIITVALATNTSCNGTFAISSMTSSQIVYTCSNSGTITNSSDSGSVTSVNTWLISQYAWIELQSTGTSGTGKQQGWTVVGSSDRVSATGSPTTLAGALSDITGAVLVLPPGDWDVSATIQFDVSVAVTSVNSVQGGVTTTNTMAGSGGDNWVVNNGPGFNGANPSGAALTISNFQVYATTVKNCFLVALANFVAGGGTLRGYGRISARRCGR